MLKVKYLTLLSKKMKKGGYFDQGCKKNRALLDFISYPVSRLTRFLPKFRVMAVFSPQHLKK